MPSIYQLKPAFQNLLRPLADALVRRGVRPNAVTAAALVLSGGCGSLILGLRGERWPLLLLPMVLLVRMALNALDGMMAREHQLASPRGALLNELGDVISDAVLYLPLATLPGFRAELVVAAVVLGVVGETAGVAAVAIGASRRYEGPMGKSDRAFVFGALGLGLGLGAPAGRWLTAVLAAVALLAGWTVVNRCRAALREVG